MGGDVLIPQSYSLREVNQEYLLYLASLCNVLGPPNNSYPEPIKGNVIRKEDCLSYSDNRQILKNKAEDYCKAVKYSNLTDGSSIIICETFIDIEYSTIYGDNLLDLDKNDTITIKDALIKMPFFIDDITTSEGAKLALQESRRLLQEI